VTYDDYDDATKDGSAIRGLMWCGALYATAGGFLLAAGLVRHLWRWVAP